MLSDDFAEVPGKSRFGMTAKPVSLVTAPNPTAYGYRSLQGKRIVAQFALTDADLPKSRRSRTSDFRSIQSTRLGRRFSFPMGARHGR